MHVLLLRRLSAASKRDWHLLPSGLSHWSQLKAGPESNTLPVSEGAIVRVDYIARLDDGSIVAKDRASFRVGNRSAGVCAVIDEGVMGMYLGDCRRMRASPQSSRGPRCEHRHAPVYSSVPIALTSAHLRAQPCQSAQRRDGGV